MARIVACDIFKYAYDLGGYKLSYGALNEINPVILKLTDSEGFVGWGEANPQPPFTAEDCDDVVRVLCDLLPKVLELPDTSPDAVHRLLFETRPDGDLMARGAIDIAVMDLEGKRRGVPVSALLGATLRQTIAVSRPLNNGTAEEVIPVIDEGIGQNYRHFMLKAGDKDHPALDEISRLAALKQRFGDRAVFKIDANTGWSLAEASAFLEHLPDELGAYLVYLEQPISKQDIDGLARLQRATSVPISVDESLTGLASAKEIIEKKAARAFSIKISKNGGLLQARDIAQLAAANGIEIYPNSMAEGGIVQAASLHLAVTLPNLVDAGGSFRSVLRLGGRDVTDFHRFIRNGLVHLPDGPGLGITVDEDRLRAQALAVRHVA